MIETNSGEWIEITRNYRYNRTKLYAALAKANPAIRLTKCAWRFRRSRSFALFATL